MSRIHEAVTAPLAHAGMVAMLVAVADALNATGHERQFGAGIARSAFAADRAGIVFGSQLTV